MLAEQDSDRVGFFSRCTADDAYPGLIVGALALKQPRDHLAAEYREGLGIAKEVGYAEQPVGFFRLALQSLEILLDGFNLQGFHPTLETRCNCAFLVLAEIVAAPAMEQAMNFCEVRDDLLAKIAEVAIGRR